MSSVGRVALVHDWLVGWGGSESVLLSLSRMFPDAPIYTFVWDPDPVVEERFGRRTVRPVVPNWVRARGRFYRSLLPVMPAGFESLDLGAYDLVISSSHAFSKAVRVRAGARHLCYCHTPPRYLWSLENKYLPGWKGRLAGPLTRRLRERDRAASDGVDSFAANSATVAARIRRSYERDARVITPPVDVERFEAAALPAQDREDYLVAGGRMVSYKRLDLAIEAASRGGLHLKVFGEGPEERRLRALAGPSVEFLGRVSDECLADVLGRAAGFLFPGEEDFGILPVEAQAAGCPVLAFGRGGASETVHPGSTGLFFDEQTVESLLAGVDALRRRAWNSREIRSQARAFGRVRFEEEARAWIEGTVAQNLTFAEAPPTVSRRRKSSLHPVST